MDVYTLVAFCVGIRRLFGDLPIVVGDAREGVHADAVSYPPTAVSLDGHGTSIPVSNVCRPSRFVRLLLDRVSFVCVYYGVRSDLYRGWTWWERSVIGWLGGD